MLMAKVVGSVVSTQKDESLVGKKLMIIQPINSEQQDIRFQQVAADTVGAGIGDYVLLTSGSSARNASNHACTGCGTPHQEHR